MTYLSRLLLNTLDRRVQSELSDCALLHSRILTAFPHVEGSGRAELGVLYRLETDAGRVALLVQSDAEPNWSALPGWLFAPGPAQAVASKRIDDALDAIRTGQTLRFRLHANPTRRVGGRDDPRRGQRVELRREEEQLAWLERKGVDAGFQTMYVAARPPMPDDNQIPDVRTAYTGKIHGRRQKDGKSHNLTFGSVLFEGELRVVDAERFRAAIRSGLGSGKAYGFGLLSVARADGR